MQRALLASFPSPLPPVVFLRRPPFSAPSIPPSRSRSRRGRPTCSPTGHMTSRAPSPGPLPWPECEETLQHKGLPPSQRQVWRALSRHTPRRRPQPTANGQPETHARVWQPPSPRLWPPGPAPNCMATTGTYLMPRLASGDEAASVGPMSCFAFAYLSAHTAQPPHTLASFRIVQAHAMTWGGGLP